MYLQSQPTCLGRTCYKQKLDRSNCLCLLSHGSPSEGDQTKELNHKSNSLRLARDALLLGLQPSTEIPLQLPVSTTLLKQSHNQVFHNNPQHFNLHAWWRGQFQEQGFSVELADRIASLQRLSTRTIYKSKWALFEKWSSENLMDFSIPSVKQVSDFSCTCIKILTGARRPLMVTGWPLLTHWAQWVSTFSQL